MPTPVLLLTVATGKPVSRTPLTQDLGYVVARATKK